MQFGLQILQNVTRDWTGHQWNALLDSTFLRFGWVLRDIFPKSTTGEVTTHASATTPTAGHRIKRSWCQIHNLFRHVSLLIAQAGQFASESEFQLQTNLSAIIAELPDSRKSLTSPKKRNAFRSFSQQLRTVSPRHQVSKGKSQGSKPSERGDNQRMLTRNRTSSMFLQHVSFFFHWIKRFPNPSLCAPRWSIVEKSTD